MEIEQIISVEISDNNTEAFLLIRSPAAFRDLPSADLLSYLEHEAGLTRIRPEAISGLIQTEGLRPGTRTLLMSGRRPIDGTDGRVVWLLPHPLETIENVRNGSADMPPEPIYRPVAGGDPIARIRPPTTGQPGEDVYGAVLPARSGKPVSVTAGPGVGQLPDGTLVAERDGVVRCARDQVGVMPALVLDRAMLEATRELEFRGWVLARADVVSRPRMRSAFGFEILGSLEATELHTQGDLIVHGAMTSGAGGKAASVGGSVLVRELIAARVEAGEDVVCLGNATGCEITASGHLRLRQGCVLGGQVSAARGIATHTIGNPRGTRTTIAFGADLLSEKRLEQTRQQIDVNNQKASELRKKIDYYSSKTKYLSAEDREAMTEWYFQAEKFDQQAQSLQARAAALGERIQNAREGEITVAEVIHPGVEINYRGESLYVDNPMHGPLRIHYDPRERRLKVSPTAG